MVTLRWHDPAGQVAQTRMTRTLCLPDSDGLISADDFADSDGPCLCKALAAVAGGILVFDLRNSPRCKDLHRADFAYNVVPA